MKVMTIKKTNDYLRVYKIKAELICLIIIMWKASWSLLMIKYSINCNILKESMKYNFFIFLLDIYAKILRITIGEYGQNT